MAELSVGEVSGLVAGGVFLGRTSPLHDLTGCG